MAMVAKSTSPDTDTEGWLTQEQAADLLGTSPQSIRRWANSGRLEERRAQRGTSLRWRIVYDPAQLAKMPRRHIQLPANEAGELNARVFELLDEGKSVREIVIVTREPQLKIEGLRDGWLDAGGANLVMTDDAKAALEKFVGPFSTVLDLATRVTAAKVDLVRFVGPFDCLADLIARVAGFVGETIVATVPDDVTDADVERAIGCALAAAESTAP